MEDKTGPSDNRLCTVVSDSLFVSQHDADAVESIASELTFEYDKYGNIVGIENGQQFEYDEATFEAMTPYVFGRSAVLFEGESGNAWVGFWYDDEYFGVGKEKN